MIIKKIINISLVVSLLISAGTVFAGKYIKVSNSGQSLPDRAVLGSGPNDWACTYDSETRLLWEVKTDDGGMRDKDWNYAWYNSDPATNGGDAGTENGKESKSCEKGSFCNTEDYQQRVNTQGLCGAKDWSLPSIDDLKTLVYCSSGTPMTWNTSGNKCGGVYQQPTIDHGYFPNTRSYFFWSASVHASNSSTAWFVLFNYGYDNFYFKNDANAVRLVRGGQLLDPFLLDAQPDAFAFDGQENVAFGTNITSSAITVAGINTETPISIENGEYRINNGSFTGVNGVVNQGDMVQVRHTSGSIPDQSISSKLTIGGVSASFTSTTKAEVANPVEQGEGYVEGVIVNACNQQPLPSADIQFIRSGSPDRPQQTNRDGRYVLKLEAGSYDVSTNYKRYESDTQSIDLAKGETRIVNFDLTPEAGCHHVQPAESKQAIIIAGSGPKLPTGDNNIWRSTLALTDRAYNALRLQGFKREDIRYFTADGQSREPEDDGVNVVSGTANLQNLEEILTQWAGGVEQLVVYLVGHGGVGTFQLGRNTLLTPQQLRPWLDSAQAKLITDQRGEPGKLTLILESCKSGSFIAPLAANNRYIISSTSADLDAIIGNRDGTKSFSYHFWGQIGFKDGWLSKAFKQARQAMSGELVAPGKTQKAILDADGSGGGTTEDDYAAIGNYCYGDCNPHASVGVVIESVSPLADLEGELSATLTVRASKPVKKAWVTLQRPDYHYPTDGTAISSLLTVELDCAERTCQAEYNNFNLNDYYAVSFFVQDFDGNTAVPYTLNLYQSGLADSGKKKNASAVYEGGSHILTLKDVKVADQHYYVELIEQQPFQFSILHIQALTEASSDEPALFDGTKVSIPGVYAFGSYYAVDLLPAGEVFTVGNVILK